MVEKPASLEKLATKGNITKAKSVHYTRKTLYSPQNLRKPFLLMSLNLAHF